jgi:hypothetical protein
MLRVYEYRLAELRMSCAGRDELYLALCPGGMTEAGRQRQRERGHCVNRRMGWLERVPHVSNMAMLHAHVLPMDPLWGLREGVVKISCAGATTTVHEPVLVVSPDAM